MIIMLFFCIQAFGQSKSKVEIVCESEIIFDSIKVENKFYRYKIADKYFVTYKNKRGLADVILPEFNRKSDSITLNKVMSKISKLHKLQFLTVAQDCKTLLLYSRLNGRRSTPEEDAIMEEKFIGIFDLLTNKKVRIP